MQALEKILEEIEEAARQEDAPIYCGDMEVDGYVRMSVVCDIIRKHMNDGWIPVEERMPEGGEEVLVQWEFYSRCDNMTYTYIHVMRLNEMTGEWNGTYGVPNGKVIAWRPLPDPYCPEEKGAFAEMRKNVMNIEGKIRYIAEYYGYEPQSRQLIEEMAELTVAINKLWRRHEYGATSKEIAKAHMDVLEEIADVTVMLCQIEYLLGIGNLELDYATEKKLNRQIERIHKNNQGGKGFPRESPV